LIRGWGIVAGSHEGREDTNDVSKGDRRSSLHVKWKEEIDGGNEV
jgi:hypothetical protein